MAIALSLVGCTQTSSVSAGHTRRPKAPASSTRPSSASQPRLLISRPLVFPEVAVTPAGVYLAWQISPQGADTSQLALVDVATGRFLATAQLGAAFDQAVAAGGSLWVATSSATAGETLLQLNPISLAIEGRTPVGGGSDQGWAGQVLAAAGGGLWVAGGDRLLFVSLPAGQVTTVVPLPGAATSTLAANSSGTILVIGEANASGVGGLQRRDPATGALLASYPTAGVIAPRVAGVVGSSVWMSVPTGMMGYVARFDAATMQPPVGTCGPSTPPTAGCVKGTNGITAQVANGLVWVTDPVGGAANNLCADGVTGRVLAPLDLPSQDRLLAIGPNQVFVASPAGGAKSYVMAGPLPAGCGG